MLLPHIFGISLGKHAFKSQKNTFGIPEIYIQPCKGLKVGYIVFCTLLVPDILMVTEPELSA